MKRLLLIAIAVLGIAAPANAQLKSEANLNIGHQPVSNSNPVPVAPTNPIGASSTQMQGTAVAGASPVGNPVQAGGVGADGKMHPLSTDNSGQPNVNVPTQLPAALDGSGNLKIHEQGTANVNVSSALPAGTNVIGKVGIDQTTPGTTNAVNGAPVSPVHSSALEPSHVIKGSAGALANLAVTNHLTSPVWVLVLDAASDPGNGTVSPLWWQELPAATATADASGTWGWGLAPLKASAGLTVVCSTTGPFTETQTANCGISGQAL